MPKLRLKDGFKHMSEILSQINVSPLSAIAIWAIPKYKQLQQMLAILQSFDKL